MEMLHDFKIAHRGHELPGKCSAGVLACKFTRRPAGCSCWRRDAAATRSRDGCATRLMESGVVVKATKVVSVCPTMRTECIKPARSLLRRALWFGLWGLLGIMVLAISLYVMEDWRGRAAWAKFKREWEAKGEHFDLAALLAPPVPDDENFLKAPLVESWFYKKPADQKPARV